MISIKNVIAYCGRNLPATLSVLGFLLAILASANYGSGLSPDSIGYIAVARNIASGAGAVSFDHTPLIMQPPLYPALLAFVATLAGIDPLAAAPLVNALLFGLIIYLGGRLALRHLSLPPLATAATLGLLFAKPLFFISSFAWSEPLFICLSLSALLLMEKYLDSGNAKTLLLLSLAVAMACVSRYIGVTLIVWGATIILLSGDRKIGHKLGAALLFAFIAATPLALWLARNQLIANTYTGVRPPSSTGLLENLEFTGIAVVKWFAPIIAVMGLYLIASLLTGNRFELDWKRIGGSLHKLRSIVFFPLVYIAFLVVASTISFFDTINSRLLSPAYVPLLVILLFAWQVLINASVGAPNRPTLQRILSVSLPIWLIFIAVDTTRYARHAYRNGLEYADKSWKQNQLVDWLRNNRLDCDGRIYSNAPDALYIFTRISAEMSPFKPADGGAVMPKYHLDWPQDGTACLVWFENIPRDFIVSLEELTALSNLSPIAGTDDGAVYYATKKL